MSSVQKAKQKANKPLDAAEIYRNSLIFELNTTVTWQWFCINLVWICLDIEFWKICFLPSFRWFGNNPSFRRTELRGRFQAADVWQVLYQWLLWWFTWDSLVYTGIISCYLECWHFFWLLRIFRAAWLHLPHLQFLAWFGPRQVHKICSFFLTNLHETSF